MVMNNMLYIQVYTSDELLLSIILGSKLNNKLRRPFWPTVILNIYYHVVVMVPGNNIIIKIRLIITSTVGLIIIFG